MPNTKYSSWGPLATNKNKSHSLSSCVWGLEPQEPDFSLLRKYDFIKILIDSVPLYWPRELNVPGGINSFPDCCGAGLFQCVPEKPLGISFSPACYVHDHGYMNRPADKILWREHFNINNDVMQYNLESLIDNLSKTPFELRINEYIKDLYMNVVRSYIGWWFYE